MVNILNHYIIEEKAVDTKTRPHTISIKALKERIKSLAAGQRPLKRARKTLISAEERCALLKKANVDPRWIGEDDADLSTYVCRILLDRSMQITACLNLSHRQRGSKYVHGYRKGYEYEYTKALTKIVRELQIS